MKDTLFVINPHAASGRTEKVWSSLQDRIAGLRDISIVKCSARDSASKAIQAALTPGVRRVVVMGGDGTLHFTLNLLLQQGAGNVPSLGLIPVGTGSDLARGLGLETRPKRALEQAMEAAPKPLDVLRLQDGRQSRFIINETSLGITTLVAARVNAMAKRNTMSFLAAALRELIDYQPQWARIHLDGKLWREGFFYMVVVANGTHFAKGMRVAPKANPADGKAEVIVVEAVNKALVLAWLPTIYLGWHMAAPFIHRAQAETIAIDTGASPRTFEGDGEMTLSTPATVSLVPQAIMFNGLKR